MKQVLQWMSLIFLLMGGYLLYSFLFAGADNATGVGGASFLSLSLALFLFSFSKFLKQGD
tara:strand:- start:1572 stop:1751 length:180 start_codon:yes stop_codon:yes gene_type:complete